MNRYLKGILAGLAGVALLVGGFATASNMGFKFVPNVAANQAFNLSVPWNNNFTKANQLFNDLDGQDADLLRLSKFNANSTFLNWFAGAAPANNFNVVKGEAYILFAAATGPISSAVVVGSHDPNFTFSFTANQAFNAAAPYHQTFTRANQLFNDMNTRLGAGSIQRISKYNPNATFLNWFSGAAPANNFNLDLGMGVIIFPAQTKSGYVWPHY
jgi:hypothetical protein